MIPFRVSAANGLPGYPKFGYGARLNATHQNLETAIATASNLDLDWLAVDFDWSTFWPSPGQEPDFSRLDAIMSLAHSQELAVLVSITNPPPWVLTSNGPDSQLTTRIVSDLVKRYPETLLAIEPFPGANTQKGWGAAPDPRTYAGLVETIYHTLQEFNSEIVVVAAGLEPTLYEPADIDDLTFLKALYQQGSATFMPVIGLRLPNIAVTPTEPPGESQVNTLRHYEAVREVMLQNNHHNGLIWVTGFSWDDRVMPSPQNQAVWLKQALLMMRAQLYIGTAFVQGLRPFYQAEPVEVSNHPGIGVLRQIIALENSRHTRTFEFSMSKSALNQITKNH